MRAKESFSLILRGAEIGGSLPSGTSSDLDLRKLSNRNRKDSKASGKSGGGETIRREENGDDEDLTKEVEMEKSKSSFKRPFLGRKSSSKSEKDLNGSQSILSTSLRRPKTSEGSKMESVKPVLPKRDSAKGLTGGTSLASTASNNGSFVSGSFSTEDEESRENTVTKKTRGRFASFGASVGNAIPGMGHRTNSSVDVNKTKDSKEDTSSSSNSNSNSSVNNSQTSISQNSGAGEKSNWAGFMRKKDNGFQAMDEGGGFSGTSVGGTSNVERPKGRGRSISALSSRNSEKGTTPKLLKKELESESEEEIDLFDSRPSMVIDEPIREISQQVLLGRDSLSNDSMIRPNPRKPINLENPLSPIPNSPLSSDSIGFGNQQESGWTSFKPSIDYTGGSITSDGSFNPNQTSSSTIGTGHSNFPSENQSLGFGLAPEHTGISLSAFSDEGSDPFNRLRSPSPRISLDQGHSDLQEGLKLGHTPMGSFGEELEDEEDEYDEKEALTSGIVGDGIERFKGSGNLTTSSSGNGKRGPPPPIPSSSSFLSRKLNPPPPPPLPRGNSSRNEYGGESEKKSGFGLFKK